MKAFVFLPANCSIDRKILLNFFVPFSQIQVYKSTSSRIIFNSPKILQLSTYHVPYTLLQLPSFPSKSLQNHSSTSNHPDELSTDILQKETPRTLTPKP